MARQDQPLNEQRVLVTRPAHQADPLCRLLSNAGAETVRFPTLEIASADDSNDAHQALKSCFLELDNYYAVIFVSANAARFGSDWIDTYWPQLPVGIHWLAVGDATARSLNEQNIASSSAAGGMNTESLLQLPELQQLNGQRILICRGVGGRELLAETLISRGARVDYAELYRRITPEYDDPDVESIIYNLLPSVIFVTSVKILENLDRLCRGKHGRLPIEQLQQILMIVPSQRVADRAVELGYRDVKIAKNATDQAMINALTLSLQ